MSSRILTPPLAARLAFPAVTAFLGAGLWWNASRLADGRLEWTLTLKLVLPRLALFVASGLLATVTIWTSRVWVDHDSATLHQHWGWQHNTVDLTRPRVVRLRHQPSAEGLGLWAEDVGQWKAYFARPDGPEVFVATPWVPSFVPLAEELQLALKTNPELAADDYTQRVIDNPALAATPAALGRPPIP